MIFLYTLNDTKEQKVFPMKTSANARQGHLASFIYFSCQIHETLSLQKYSEGDSKLSNNEFEKKQAENLKTSKLGMKDEGWRGFLITDRQTDICNCTLF